MKKAAQTKKDKTFSSTDKHIKKQSKEIAELNHRIKNLENIFVMLKK